MKKTKRPAVTHSDMIRMNFEDKLRRTDFFVEANSFEVSAIWGKYVFDNPNKKDSFDNKDINGMEWIQDSGSFGKTVGYISTGKKRPVTVHFCWYAIGDKYVCFYNPTSRYVDWDMAENWITKHFPVKYDNGTRPAMTDASNFHDCYWFCKDE